MRIFVAVEADESIHRCAAAAAANINDLIDLTGAQACIAEEDRLVKEEG